MMTDPVDLNNLRDMTGDDKEMEQMLFEEFISSSEECIAIMENSCTDGENETWRSNAHAIKGTSINLGAEKLGELFREAQENHNAPAEEKQRMLVAIKDEFTKVKEFLQDIG